MNKQFLVNYLKNVSDIMMKHKEELILMDSIVGDGDLGLTMSDGFAAAYNSIANDENEDLGRLLYMSGRAMATAVPSTMGTLMASGLMQDGKEFKGKTETDLSGLYDLFKAFQDGVQHRGKAKVGEKTFVDGLNGAVISIKESLDSNQTYVELVNNAYDGAVKGYQGTVGMLAVHGRAATRGEASRKLKDPGAYVAVLLMESLKNTKE
jgi:dihydroxyacetone kinase-like protein